jgi:iron(III) transport system substrate-binding protein
MGCRAEERHVVVYASLDQVHAEPLLRRFETRTGIRVLPVFDVEASKTTGLAQRLSAERSRPQADVFWSGELAQTARLADDGLFAVHRPASLVRPAACTDPAGLYVTVGGRLRVLLVNTDNLTPARYPRTLDDLLSDRVPGERVGVAWPLFGTTATHAAALYATRGPEAARSFFTRLRARGARFVGGNSVVRDLVARGELWAGLTDADDARSALAAGAPIAVVWPDQAGAGTLLLAGTAAVVARGPHPAEARALVDFLASAESERALVGSGFAQLVLGDLDHDRPVVPPEPFERTPVKLLQLSGAELSRPFPRAQRELAELLR